MKQKLDNEVFYFQGYPLTIGATTNDFGDFSIAKNCPGLYQRLMDVTNSDCVIRLSPASAARVWIVDEYLQCKSDDNYLPLNYDGVICQRKLIDHRPIFVVPTADTPVMVLSDDKKSFLTFVVCDWRNLTGQIIRKTIKMICNNLNLKKEALAVFIWPGICGRCYDFNDAQALANINLAVSHKDHGRVYLDLKKTIIAQLDDIGIPEDNIDSPGFCSKHSPGFDGVGHFFASARREPKNPRRNVVFAAFP